MHITPLTAYDLSIAALLVVALSLCSFRLKLGLEFQVIVAGIRTTVQLLLIGVVLKALFAHVHIGWLSLMASVMLLMAGWEVVRRQKRKYAGWWGFGMGAVSMLISSFSITVFALIVIIDIKPWYEPQYAVPLLGMLLGNTMNGVSISLDRLTHTAWDKRAIIESRLMLGEDWMEAVGDIRRESVKSGMIPIINAMAVAGVVSLPGMMTGQILAGSPPLEAVKYQILIMFLIAAGTGFGTICAVWLGRGDYLTNASGFVWIG